MCFGENVIAACLVSKMLILQPVLHVKLGEQSTQYVPLGVRVRVRLLKYMVKGITQYFVT